MNKAIAAALLIVGVVVLYFGFNASDSFASEISEAVHGAPTDRSIILIVGGALLGAIGLFGLLGRSRRA